MATRIPAVSRLPLIPPGLPVLEGFREELLPALVALWAVLVGTWLVGGREHGVAVAIWATVTTIMLWPVGRKLGRRYLSYRAPLFILGVLSMAYIPAMGFVLQSGLPYWAKVVLWVLLPVDLTLFAILPSLRQAIGRPIRMFFRPDLLFGDGRVLCCGTVALLFGIRYLIGPHPPEGVPVAIPRWNWWGIAFAMAFGFIPLIPLRGMAKLFMRMARLVRDEWYGWWGIFLKETFLAVTVLAIALGFHHVFKGIAPFDAGFWEEAREAMEHRGPWPGLVFLAFGYVWLVGVRGGYKKAIGEPFIRETVTQTWVKEVLYVLGVVPLVIGLMLLIEGHFGQLNKGPMLAVGIPFFLWGLACLTGFRVIAQVNQRQALVQQMVAVVLPAQLPGVRRKVLGKVVAALAEMPERQRLLYLRAMQEALAQAPEEVRDLMARERLEALAELPPDRRRVVMSSMDRVLFETP
ncbi:MAG: hypothetical protein QN193_05600 [Armatimonadota bacterium]|nr:hypothetical protein [Armatimonadota bacterium]MDR7440431.1 hypothetical protein [Armatimonadota bacterium]MDR7443967.1 hypothetical protein [Armatimonadota bacterium]MDR7570065.1 hypothetical protein [Armatimonadota bacterium]MDR7615430.1 hypothetical protein [Armatimonadota bacterium]